MKNSAWRLTENKSGGGWEGPRFHIEYDRLSGMQAKKELSFKLISLLKQNSDLIIRIDSQLLSLPPNERGDAVLNLIGEFKSQGLEFRYRQFPGNNSSGFWYQLLRLDRNETMESMVYVPGQAWQGSLHSRMTYGTFYYVCHSGDKGLEVLDDLFNGKIQRFELGKFFRLLIFDSVISGHMGIFTDVMELKDIESLLLIR